MTRQEHLAWCKQRALECIDGGDANSAIASMMSDLSKWDGGQMYDATMLQIAAAEVLMFRRTPDDIRNWVEGFN